MKFKTYDGRTLYDAQVSLKIDGVRAHLINDQIVSRSMKPLYNIPKKYKVCEVFLGDWESTVSAVRTQGGELLDESVLYSLDPIDSRLLIGHFNKIDSETLKMIFESVTPAYEGLVVLSEGVHYKIKGEETYDVIVRDVIPGKGKYIGKMGALVTDMGNVGTGFSDEQREWDFLGKTIEVSCMSLTPSGKFRHPRFKRLREDK